MMAFIIDRLRYAVVRLPDWFVGRKLYRPVVEVEVEPTAAILQIQARDVPTLLEQVSKAAEAGRGYRLIIRNLQGFITLIEHDSEALTAPPFEIKFQVATQTDSILSGYNPAKGYRGRWNRVEMGLPLQQLPKIREFCDTVNAYIARRRACLRTT